MIVQEIIDHKGSATIAVRSETPFRDLAALMAAKKIGALMVVDGNDDLIGIVSERDLVRTIAERGERTFELSAAAVMSSPVITCAPESSVEMVLKLMLTYGIRHLPITRDREKLGVISIRDVLDYRIAGLEANISALRHAKQETNEARTAAELANRAKSEFLANASHELMTPLHAVIGFSELMLKEPHGPIGAPQYRAYLQDIEVSGRHLIEIIGRVLDLSRIETGDLRPLVDSVDVAGVAASCIGMMADRAGKSGITLSAAPFDGLPQLRADERMLRQMLNNLIGNAIKFTPAGGCVTVCGTSDESGAICLSVADTGIGIAPEEIAKVAQPFHQADGSISRRYDGSGLGLVLVKRMMEMHDGRLVLTSAVGVGTTATLWFPGGRFSPQPAPDVRPSRDELPSRNLRQTA
jgi:signal transduction histidine kinase